MYEPNMFWSWKICKLGKCRKILHKESPFTLIGISMDQDGSNSWLPSKLLGASFQLSWYLQKELDIPLPYWIHRLYNPQPRWAKQSSFGRTSQFQDLRMRFLGTWSANEECSIAMCQRILRQSLVMHLWRGSLVVGGLKLPEVVKWTNCGQASQFLNAKTHQKEQVPAMLKSTTQKLPYIILNC